MWWQFQKIFEDERFVRYAYSRDCRELDGIMQYDRKEETVTVLQPCRGDEDSEKLQTMAAEKMFLLAEEGFPERRQVACG